MTDRVDALVRCRPELGSDETVGALVTEMFEDAKFQQSRPFLEGLWKDGLISSVGVCSCSHKAFQGRSILGGFDAVAWLLSRTPKGTLQSCDGFAGDLLEAMFWVGDKMMGVVSTLQNAGLQVDRDEYALFRTAYMQYVIYGYIKSVSDALAPPRRDLFLAAKAKTDAEVTSSYPFANVPSNDPNPGNLPGLRAVIRKRMAEYCPQRMSYCSAAPATR
jgi:hypothetical protein